MAKRAPKTKPATAEAPAPAQEMQPEPRRLQRLTIVGTVLLLLLKEMDQRKPGRVVTRGIPADAELVAMHYDSERLTFELVLESASFEPVKAGELIPEFNATITREV